MHDWHVDPDAWETLSIQARATMMAYTRATNKMRSYEAQLADEKLRQQTRWKK